MPASPSLLPALRDIESRDPDGGSALPTTADYAAHEEWAIATHGRAAWTAYVAGGWEPESDE